MPYNRFDIKVHTGLYVLLYVSYSQCKLRSQLLVERQLRLLLLKRDQRIVELKQHCSQFHIVKTSVSSSTSFHSTTGDVIPLILGGTESNYDVFHVTVVVVLVWDFYVDILIYTISYL